MKNSSAITLGLYPESNPAAHRAIDARDDGASR
jgi:hypothetical protein